MSSSPGRGLLHLAAAVDQPEGRDIGPYAELARLAERGGLDFVTLDEAFARPGFDASAALSRVAPVTRRVGLVPTLTAAPTELLPVPAAIAALDRVSRGRAGWRTDVFAPDEEARLSGRPAAQPEARWREAGEVAVTAAGSWDGRADGAGTRRARGGRFGDADTLRRAGFRGSAATANGPSAGPGSPQGHPVRVVDAAEGRPRSAAACHADVALVRVASPARARAARDRLRSEAAGAGRDPDSLRVMASLLIDLGDGEHAAHPGHGGGGPRQTPRGPLYRGGPVDLADLIASWRQEGAVDGFHLTPVEPRRDLERLVNGTVALLQHRGLFRTFYPGSTLREHLGLARPADRSAGGAA
ncbi:LLM class flavin-dependent oxidoreductase [Streptomyces rishiriensis]|uniref:LLM class flavin-dependent oxidoreductase n=1 Tax=Streptomyces rishiriensis TaxID=68264 RepID=UPI000D59BA39|nr:LLM class flavin-dependent oxidoreductase [Streptomyces rishiriensis]